MFKYNPKTNYQPNGGHYLQILSGKDLYRQTIVVTAGSHGDTFPVRFPNIFVDYPLGQMRVGDKLWTNWNKAPLRLWQTQLNYAVFCASSACGVSSAHLNYTKHPMIRSVYRFHVYYHVRRVLKRLQTPLQHATGFNVADNPYASVNSRREHAPRGNPRGFAPIFHSGPRDLYRLNCPGVARGSDLLSKYQLVS